MPSITLCDGGTVKGEVCVCVWGDGKLLIGETMQN